MQAGANILVIGIVSHKKGAVLKTPVSQRDQYWVDALKKAFKSVYTMSHSCDDDIYDRVHHLKHNMNANGASAVITHLNRQNATVKFDFEGAGCIFLDGKSNPNTVSDEDKDADCTLSMSLETFEQMRSGEVDGTSAFMQGKLKVSGDMSIAMKLQSVMDALA